MYKLILTLSFFQKKKKSFYLELESNSNTESNNKNAIFSPSTNKKYFFMKSSSVDNHQDEVKSSVPYLLPRRSNTQVNEMKNLFESKLNDCLNSNRNANPNANQDCVQKSRNTDRRFNFSGNVNRNQFTTRKSSTQPNLMSYKLNESVDKKVSFDY